MMKSNTFLARAVGLALLGVFWPMAGFAASDWLDVDPQGRVVTYYKGGVVADTAIIDKVGKCALNTVALEALVLITADTDDETPTVGWRGQDDRFGANGKANGAPCTEIRNLQSLDFNIGTKLVEDGQKITKATVKVVVEKITTVTVKAAGSEISDVVRTDLKVGIHEIEIGNGTSDRFLGVNVENSTESTNEAESGSFSVLRVTFQMTAFVKEGEIGCGVTVGAGIGAGIPGVTGVGTFTRLENSDCGAAVDFSYDFDGEKSEFLVEKPVDAIVQFFFREEHTPALIVFPSNGEPPTDALATDNPPATDSTFVQAIPLAVQWFSIESEKTLFDYCPGGPDVNATTGAVEGWNFPADFDKNADSDYDMSSEAGFQYACMVSQLVRLLPLGDCPNPNNILDLDRPNLVCVEVIREGFVEDDYTRLRGF